ncbi:helix-turn-helix domain-containing protein [Actinomadura rugatobispora]|uniref:Helix-turn-helix domain-containing protein n=1 Tax=Actinomadura rugatobispora TaxID=1994 RepID=A0ABW1A2M3_9ACTN
MAEQEAPAVVVPPGLAGPLLRVLVRALAREVREDGGMIPPGLAPFLSELAAVADRPPVADNGNRGEAAEMIDGAGWVTVAQLAADSGHPARTLRHWASTGRLQARRVARTWLIDPESLKRGTPR